MEYFRDWCNLTYLKSGTWVQREVYDLLKEMNIMEILHHYNPILVGTVPLGIQVEGSDLDIICEVHDMEAFAGKVARYFGDRDDYCCESRTVKGMPRIKINFTEGAWPIELFGQPRTTKLQNGYLHMIIEAQLLNLMGEEFRQRVIELKSAGMKTEPAFAQLLNLEGDPYEALLNLGNCAPEVLASVINEINDYKFEKRGDKC